MNWVDVIGNAASGGALGIIGSVTSGVVSIFQAKNQYAHDEAMADLNLRLISAQSDAASKLSADQLKTMQEQQAGQAFTASQIAGGPIGTINPVIAGILSLWRPQTTAFLIGESQYLYSTTTDPELRGFIVRMIVGSCGMAIAWWWGSRQMEKFMPGKAALG